MDIELKKVELDDIELIRMWRNSKDVSQYMYSENMISSDQQLQWFNKIKTDNTSEYWIIMFDQKKIGLASITGINSILQSCYWAFYLGDLSIRGAGIGGKVEYKILEHVFESLKLNKLRCEVLVSNENVIKMHEKYGFRREAFYREHVIKNGVKIDVVGLAILKSEWDFLKSNLKSKIYGV
jgi:UDP-4-amino-4,6-dideoxy-N-acetyl-beta-L-altrosamine N-acetyltransferase